MRWGLALFGGALLGAVVATIVWLLVFADVSVRAVEDAEAPEVSAPTPIPRELTPLPADRPALVGSLLVPVAGIGAGDLVDTYTQSRAGGARRHDAIDILAPAGTPVIAAAPGTVEKLFYSDRGGITAYVRSRDQRYIYYYAHLDRYAPGIREGVELDAGDAIGLVGATGNADSEAPHLHFAVMRMREGEGWWEGEAVNPYPLLTGRAPDPETRAR